MPHSADYSSEPRVSTISCFEFFFFSSRRRHTRSDRDWSSDVCSSDLEAGDGGHMNVRDNDVTVDFTVRVPTGVRFLGKTVNGEVEAAVLSSDVEANTRSGERRVGKECRSRWSPYH